MMLQLLVMFIVLKIKKWVTNPVTMGFKLSGDYIDLTQKEAHAFINERHQ